MNFPVLAGLTIILATFLSLAMKPLLPNNFFVILLAGAAITLVVWMDRTRDRLRGIGAVEWAFALYLIWNVYSMIAPHKYPATDPLTGQVFSVPRFIITGAVIPFVMYAIGRYAFDRKWAVRALLWSVVLLAGYSAAVSIMQFTGPKALVWPRYIVDGSLTPGVDTWADRALGVFNQPVVNGMTMVIGFAVAMLLAAQRTEPAAFRFLAVLIAVACGIGIYYTYTRAVWLSAALALILGVLFAKNYRKGFLAAVIVVMTVVVANWSTFVSSDRSAGGVSSASEVDDRMNIIQTALWAAAQEPVTGWGILRFQAVNTYHHQQWSPDVPWANGYGIVSHTNEMGILAELGLIGLGLWLAVLTLAAKRLWVAYRRLPGGELSGQPLACTAIISLAVLFVSGLTVDLRLFDFPTALVFLIVGTAIGWSERLKSPPSPSEPTNLSVAQHG